jgi:protein-tyrosine phosphatase
MIEMTGTNIRFTRKYLNISILDFDNITPHIPKILEFIDIAFEEDGTVLVRCWQGINRSAAAIVSYLCHTDGKLNAEAAAHLLKLKKPDVDLAKILLVKINLHFEREGGEDPLAKFHRNLHGRTAGK